MAISNTQQLLAVNAAMGRKDPAHRLAIAARLDPAFILGCGFVLDEDMLTRPENDLRNKALTSFIRETHDTFPDSPELVEALIALFCENFGHEPEETNYTPKEARAAIDDFMKRGPAEDVAINVFILSGCDSALVETTIKKIDEHNGFGA